MPSIYKVVYTEDVLSDVGEIFNTIKEISWKVSAEKWIKTFFEKTNELRLFPEGHSCYYYDEKYRYLRIGKYIVVYYVDKNNGIVIVLRVIYSRRNLAKMKIR